MRRVCNGCYKNKPIVDEEYGYCQYCVDNRKPKEVKDILKKLDSFEMEKAVGEKK